jgi:16S rRNA (uracil1498-N3)-methyltransferase
VSIRFFCPDPPQVGRYRLDVDESRHLLRVCRHKVGDQVELFDGRGFATRAQVVEIGKDRVELITAGPPLPERASPCLLTLATAVPKGDRFDWLVEKATELGVARLIPLVTEHSVVDPRDSKLDRLRRTIVEASKQCRRNRLMILDPPVSWNDFIRSARKGLGLVAQPDGLPPGRWPLIFPGQEVLLAVGPEGGFSLAERDLAEADGWHPICLSVNGLRIETAGLAGCAAILARCEEPIEHGLA